MIDIIDTGLIYRGAESAPHFRNTYWPSVVELASGELLAAMDISNFINSRDARSYYSLSKDQGKSWSEPKIIWDGEGGLILFIQPAESVRHPVVRSSVLWRSKTVQIVINRIPILKMGE